MEHRFVEGEYTRLTKIFALTDVTKFPALQVQYIGSAAYAGFAVAAGGDITLFADDTDGETTVDPLAGHASGAATTDGVIDLSTPNAAVDTYGELCDVINTFTNWRCFMIGVHADWLTDNTLDTLAVGSSHTCRSANGLTIYLDEEAAIDATFAAAGFSISNQKFTSRPSGGWSTVNVGWEKDWEGVIENTLNYASLNVAMTGGPTFKIYACNDRDNTETLMYDTGVITTATARELGASLTPATPFIKAPLGMRLLIALNPGDTEAPTAATITAIGTTKHMTGGIVTGANYTGMV